MNNHLPRYSQPVEGSWTTAVDSDDRGVGLAWFRTPPEHPKPSVLPTPLSASDRIVWAFCPFSVDALSPEQAAFLELDCVHAACEVWLNGIRLGEASAPTFVSPLPLGAALQRGPNMLAVRMSPTGQSAALHQAQIHQKPAIGIDDVFVVPDIRRKRITVYVTAADATRIRLQFEGVAEPVEASSGKTVLEIPTAVEWSPRSPILSKLTCERVEGDTTIDAVTVTFAMRELGTRDGKILLNNRPYPLRGAMFGAGDRLDFARLKSLVTAGFNAIWISGSDMTRTLADATHNLGALMFLSLPAQEAQRERMVLALRNHPAIMAWVMRHEDATSDATQALRTADPSRPLFIETGGRFHTILPAWRDRSEPILSIDVPPQSPFSSDLRQLCRLSGDSAQMNFAILDEVTFEPDSTLFTAAFAERKLDEVFESREKMAAIIADSEAESLRLVMDVLRANSKLAGHFVALRSGASEFVRAASDAHSPLRPIIHMDRTTLTPREEAELTVYLAKDDREESQAELSLQVQGPTSQVLWKKKRVVLLPKSSKEIWRGEVGASGSIGAHRFIARISKLGKIAAENSEDFFAFETPQPCDVTIQIVGEDANTIEKCLALAKKGNAKAPVHVVLPAANTVFGYSEEPFLRMLSHVRDGAAALIFSPPDDFDALSEHLDGLPSSAARDVAVPGVHASHYAKFHPVFDTLPARGIMRQPYRDIAPLKSLTGPTDEDICGCFGMDANGAPFEGNNIVVRRFGDGRIVFTHLRIIENLATNPIADRLFVNMLQYAVRRAVPSDRLPEADHKVIEWFREQRALRYRKWMLAGFFPGESGKAHETAFPPERAVDLGAEHSGRYGQIGWTPHFSRLEDMHEIDLARTLSPFSGSNDADAGTAYAYAEFTSDRRQSVTLSIDADASLKVWMNGRPFYDSCVPAQPQPTENHVIDAFIRQGRNIVLVKLSKRPGPCLFTFNIAPVAKETLAIKWWK
jgi:hypothetical protein